MKHPDEHIDFVSRHYRRGLFDAKSGWKRLGISPAARRARILWRVAAVCAAVAITSVAAVIFHHYTAPEAPEGTAAPTVPAITSTQPGIVREIDFDNATLRQVTERIRQVYGVEVTGLTAPADTIRLTLHYQGPAADLVSTINDLTGTTLTITDTIPVR